MKGSMKKYLAYIGLAALLIFPALEAAAGRGGGHGSHGGDRSSGGHHMEDHMRQGGHGARHPGDPDMDRHMKPGMMRGMHPDTAEGMVHRYMKGRTSEPYEMGELKDKGSHFTTEIKRPDGSVRERLRIDKQTGDIHPMR